jgi:cation:H+ antiporter
MEQISGLWHGLHGAIEHNIIVALVVMAIAFIVLAKCSDLFVESSVALANRFGIPKLVIGIVLVSFATTAPELAVSLMSALKGNPEMALGNAIGSVICDDGLALALAGVFAVGGISVMPSVLKTSGIFLICIQVLTFFFVFRDFTLERWEGGVLVGLFAVYLVFMFYEHKKGNLKDDLETDAPEEFTHMSMTRMGLLFGVGLLGIILASEFIVGSATSIARHMHIPEAVIALTLVAFGTSIPEVATCIMAARKGHGEIAVGNIIGADILNICWVAGASAIANNLTLDSKQVYFMFPAMFVIVLLMLLLLRWRYKLTRQKGILLFIAYIIYLVLSVVLFPPDNKVEGSIDNGKVEQKAEGI